MKRTVALVAVLTTGAFASTADAASRPTVNRALVTAVSRWAARQDGHVTQARPWSINSHRDLVTVQFPVTFEPSGLVGSETMVMLAWRTPPWWVASGFARVSMRDIGSHITPPAGLVPTAPPAQVN